MYFRDNFSKFHDYRILGAMLKISEICASQATLLLFFTKRERCIIHGASPWICFPRLNLSLYRGNWQILSLYKVTWYSSHILLVSLVTLQFVVTDPKYYQITSQCVYQWLHLNPHGIPPCTLNQLSVKAILHIYPVQCDTYHSFFVCIKDHISTNVHCHILHTWYFFNTAFMYYVLQQSNWMPIWTL